MPGMASARAKALAAMTESPIAVTCLPIARPGVADGAGVPVARVLAPGTPALAGAVAGVAVPGSAEGDACAWVATLTRSPCEICRSIPAGAAARCSTPQPPAAPAGRTATPHTPSRDRFLIQPPV